MLKSIRYIFMALGCLPWLSSCSQADCPDDVSRSSHDVIAFSSALPEESGTRSNLITADDFNEFYVTAFKGTDHSIDKNYFSNILFSHKNGDIKDGLKIFSSDSTYSWPATNLEFFAYYPSLETLNASIVNDTEGYKLASIKISKDMTEKTDFVAAHTDSSYADVVEDEVSKDKIINLEFNHQMCLVDVKAYSANKNYDYEVVGIRLGNPAMEGTYNFNGSYPSGVSSVGAWEDLKTSKLEYTFQSGEKVAILPRTKEEAVSLMGGGGQAMVIPINNAPWDATFEKGSTQIDPTPTKQMYISVLIRVSRNNGVDIAFPYPHASEYPYPLDAAKSVKQAHFEKFFEHVVYYAVRKDNKEIINPVFFREDLPDWCYLDPDGKEPFDLWSYYEICDFEGFGWAAIPVPANWEPGKQYTYILDFTDGLGLHDPDDPDAGKPIHNVVHPTVTWGKRVKWGVQVNPWTPPKDFDPDVEIDFE